MMLTATTIVVSTDVRLAINILGSRTIQKVFNHIKIK